jgi:predicted TIM-barrel fold metal-dependent hydrolase
MNYELVSADGHLDFTWLPEDVFVQSAPSHLRDLMPRVVEKHDEDQGAGVYNAVWVCEGKELGVFGGVGFGFRAPKKGTSYRIDRMWESGFYDGDPHPANPEMRLHDQKLDGLDAEVLYGMTGAGIHIDSPEVLTATYRIFNEWAADFCDTHPGRFYALASIPVHDPQVAADELSRAAQLGPIRGCELAAPVVTHPIYTRDGYWDPLWRTAAETQMPVSFHQGGGLFPIPPPPEMEIGDSRVEQQLRVLKATGGGPSPNQQAYQAVTNPLIQLAGAQWLCSIIASGACEKYPEFRFVLGEQGAGWVPFVLGRMDNMFRHSRASEEVRSFVKLLPSEYWFRQGATTFQEEPCVGQMAHLIGEDNLMWGSDYPHPDGVWPDSRTVIQETMGNLPGPVLRKIICENAVRLYRMGE